MPWNEGASAKRAALHVDPGVVRRLTLSFQGRDGIVAGLRRRTGRMSHRFVMTVCPSEGLGRHIERAITDCAATAKKTASGFRSI
jgi:hypothetical protein